MDTIETPTARWIEQRDVVAVIELGEIRCEAHRLPIEACALCNGHNYTTLRSGRVADRLEGGYYTTSETMVSRQGDRTVRWSGGTGSNPHGLIEQKDSMRGETEDSAAQAYFVKAGERDLPTAGYRFVFEPPIDPDELRLPRWAESELDFEELASDRQAADAAGMSWNAWHYARREPERHETATAVEESGPERLTDVLENDEPLGFRLAAIMTWRRPRQRAWSRWGKDW